MSYASLLFVASVVVPPSRLSFFLHWLCSTSSFVFTVQAGFVAKQKIIC